jgi:hypothetical protein
VLENGTLRIIFRPLRVEIIGEWRKLKMGFLICTLLSDIRVIKSSKIGWAGNVACIQNFSCKSEGKRQLWILKDT